MLPKGLQKYVGTDSESQVKLWVHVTPHIFSASFLEAQKCNKFRGQNKDIIKSEFVFPSLCDMVDQALLIHIRPEKMTRSTPTRSTKRMVSVIPLNLLIMTNIIAYNFL
jgi:hypothetical protein